LTANLTANPIQPAIATRDAGHRHRRSWPPPGRHPDATRRRQDTRSPAGSSARPAGAKGGP